MIFDNTGVESTIEESFNDVNEIMEMLIVDEVSRLSESAIQEFCAPGGVGEQLVQEGKLRNKTFVRLSKQDDLTRRKARFAIKCAKEHNDPLYKKWIKVHTMEKELLKKMYAKYDSKAMKLAKQAQKEYLHPASSKKVLPAKFLNNGVGRAEEDD